MRPDLLLRSETDFSFLSERPKLLHSLEIFDSCWGPAVGRSPLEYVGTLLTVVGLPRTSGPEGIPGTILDSVDCGTKVGTLDVVSSVSLGGREDYVSWHSITHEKTPTNNISLSFA